MSLTPCRRRTYFTHAFLVFVRTLGFGGSFAEWFTWFIPCFKWKWPLSVWIFSHGDNAGWALYWWSLTQHLLCTLLPDCNYSLSVAYPPQERFKINLWCLFINVFVSLETVSLSAFVYSHVSVRVQILWLFFLLCPVVLVISETIDDHSKWCSHLFCFWDLHVHILCVHMITFVWNFERGEIKFIWKLRLTPDLGQLLHMWSQEFGNLPVIDRNWTTYMDLGVMSSAPWCIHHSNFQLSSPKCSPFNALRWLSAVVSSHLAHGYNPTEPKPVRSLGTLNSLLMGLK